MEELLTLASDGFAFGDIVIPCAYYSTVRRKEKGPLWGGPLAA